MRPYFYPKWPPFDRLFRIFVVRKWSYLIKNGFSRPKITIYFRACLRYWAKLQTNYFPDKSNGLSNFHFLKNYKFPTIPPLFQIHGEFKQFLRFSWFLEKSFFENLFFFGKILHFLKFQSANILFRAESMLLAALTTHRDVIFDQLGEITDRFKPSDEEFAR